MKRKQPQSRIELRAKVMLGKPVVRGTRITVELIIEKLAARLTVEQVLKEYWKLERADVLAALDYARQTLGTDEIFPRIQSD